MQNKVLSLLFADYCQIYTIIFNLACIYISTNKVTYAILNPK